MVCSLSPIALFQPALPTDSRCLTKPIRRVSSRRKWVWSSITSWFDSASARWSASSGVAASAVLTSKTRPKTWFIATNEAAMPAAVWKNCRRDSPCRRASRSLSSLSRASTSRCLALCGTGIYSSLDTIWVGTGDGNDDVSAGCNSRNCSSDRNFMFASWGLEYGVTRHLNVQQPGRVAAEDRSALAIVESGCPLDHADRINLSHVGGIVGAHQDVIRTILLDQIVELMVGVDKRVKIDALEVGRRHPVELFAAIRPRRRGVVDATRIGRQEAAAMGNDELQVRMVAQHAAKDQMMERHGRIERVADHIGKIVVGKASSFGEPVRMHEHHEAKFLAAGEDLAETFGRQILSGNMGHDLDAAKTQRFVQSLELGDR